MYFAWPWVILSYKTILFCIEGQNLRYPYFSSAALSDSRHPPEIHEVMARSSPCIRFGSQFVGANGHCDHMLIFSERTHRLCRICGRPSIYILHTKRIRSENRANVIQIGNLPYRSVVALLRSLLGYCQVPFFYGIPTDTVNGPFVRLTKLFRASRTGCNYPSI